MFAVKIKGAEHRNIILCHILVKTLYFKCLYSIVKTHMNKKHWNTINLDGTVPDKEVFSWIDHSYELITGKR
jgi:hypothetical protein